MTPREAALALKKIQRYASSGRPDRRVVVAELRKIRDAISSPHQAAQVDKFTRTEYEAAIKGLQALFDKLTKAAKTMNPQDPDRAELEGEANNLLQLKNELSMGYKNISKLNV